MQMSISISVSYKDKQQYTDQKMSPFCSAWSQFVLILGQSCTPHTPAFADCPMMCMIGCHFATPQKFCFFNLHPKRSWFLITGE